MYNELKEYIEQESERKFSLWAVSQDWASYKRVNPTYYVHIHNAETEETFVAHNSNMFAAAAFAIQDGKDS